MGAGRFNIFIIFMIYLSNNFNQSHGSSEDFQVIQPQNQTVNSTLVASISCEHNADVNSVADVRLNSLSPTGHRTLLCQKGKQDCKDIFMQKVNSKKYRFILINIGQEAMSMRYQCEFTVVKEGIDRILRGDPTVLLTGKEEAETCKPPPPQAPPPPESIISWILIGLLALLFLYSCVMTSFYLRLRFSDRQPDNGTYVVMRKAPLPRNSAFDI